MQFKDQMMEFTDEVFEKRVVRLDDNRYIRCTFRDCQIVFGATGTTIVTHCSFYNCEFALDKSAVIMLDFLRDCYTGFGDLGRTLVEGTFEQLRKEALERQGKVEQ